MKATVRVVFQGESKSPSTFEKTVAFEGFRDPGGDEFAAQYLLAELEKESRSGKYWEALADVSGLNGSVKQTFRLAEIASGVYEDRMNTWATWVEITHTLLRAKGLLARSRALHDVQQLTVEGSEAENVVWHLHLDKMDNFDLAVIFLGKVSELAARLIFERLGASLVPNLDRSNPNWERDLTWSRIARGFADRSGNPQVALSESEYREVREILDGFLDVEYGGRLLAYEHKFVHRITPSVDNPGFYTHLEDREMTPIVDEKTGLQKGWKKSFGAIRSTAEYSSSTYIRTRRGHSIIT